jgi:hypothetical protein
LVGGYRNFLSDHLGIISKFTWDEKSSTPSNELGDDT